MRFMSALCAVALMTPVPGLSQTSPPNDAQTSPPNDVRLDVGSRVRIAAPVFGPKKQVGTVISMTNDTLVLRQGANTAYRSVATSDISALEVSRGTYTRKAKGALWGLLIGGGAGAIAGYISYEDPKPCPDFSCLNLNFGPGSKSDSAMLGGALGGIVGALVGAFVGRHPTDAWAPATVGTK